MKLVKNLVFAMVLASVLAVSASAVRASGGEQSTPGAVAPPPPPQAVIIPDDGTISGDGNTETSDYLFYEALAALLSMY
jgi:hypothetical protein